MSLEHLGWRLSGAGSDGGARGESRLLGWCSLEPLEPRLLLSSILFSDAFDVGIIDTTKWIEAVGVTVDGVGIDEPSAPSSLRLNGDGVGGDRVTSKVIDLSDFPAASLSYAYQRTGGGDSPEAGDDLVIEGWNGTRWVELQRHWGDGENMGSYAVSTITLVGSQMHDEFQLRIRSLGSLGPYDDWFVDDVAVSTIDSTGVKITEHSPEGTSRPVDSLTVTFDMPVDPDSFTVDDVSVVAGSPALISSLVLGDRTSDMEVFGAYAYVASAETMKVVDVSDPVSPVVVAEFDVGAEVYDIAISGYGRYAFLALGTQGVKVVDIDDPSSPVLAGSLVNPGGAYHIAKHGATRFYVGNNQGIQAYKFAQPSSIQYLGGYDTATAVTDLALNERKQVAYVACGNEGVLVVDVRYLDSMSLLSTAATGYVRSVSLEGSSVYVAAEGNVHIFDASDRNALGLVGSVRTAGHASDVIVADSFAFVAIECCVTNLEIIDISDLSSPESVGVSSSDWGSNSVAIIDGAILVSDHDGELRAFQVYKTPTAVVAESETTFRVEFAAELPEGEYRVHIGPGIEGVFGIEMDQDSDELAGEPLEDLYAFSFSTRTSEVLGRYVFYNNSQADGYDPSPGAGDDAAIAADKQALLPGEEPAPANWTTFASGLTGVMVDIDGYAGNPMPDDFDFRVSASPDADGWAAAPGAASLTVRAGEGVDGSDRVTITWPESALRNTWLKVTVRANERTGLIEDDIFFFGNLEGDANGDAVVDLDDFVLLKQGFGEPAQSVGSGADFNRNGAIDVDDFASLKRSFGATLASFIPTEALSVDVLAMAAESTTLSGLRQISQASMLRSTPPLEHSFDNVVQRKPRTALRPIQVGRHARRMTWWEQVRTPATVVVLDNLLQI